MEQNIGIYCWTSIPSGKRYIGQSVDLKKRKRAFLRFNSQYSSKTSKINKARKKHNRASDWKYEILEYCDEERLDEKERYWISFFNTIEEGYNLETGGHENKHLSEETKKKLSEGRKGIEPWNKSKTGIYTEETKRRMSEGRKGKLSGENHPNYGKHLSDSLRKKISESRKGKLKGEDNPWFGKHLTEETKRKLSESHKGKPNYKSRKLVLQYDLDGNFIKEWDSLITIKKELDINTTCISEVCNGNRKSAYGYMWRFYEGVEIPSKIQPCKRNTKSLPILQYSKEGLFLKKWDSITTVFEELGIRNISAVCRGKLKTAGNFIWRYYDGGEIPLYTEYYKRVSWNTGNGGYELVNNRKTVLQFDLDGNFIKEWNGIVSASKELCINRSLISSVCHGKRKSAGGYVFSFINT